MTIASKIDLSLQISFQMIRLVAIKSGKNHNYVFQMHSKAQIYLWRAA